MLRHTTSRMGPFAAYLAARTGLDRLDIMHAAAIPRLPDSGTARRGEAFKQAGHRTVRPMCGDQLVAPEGGLPFTLAAGHEDGLARLVGEPIDGLLGRQVARPPPW